MFIRFERIHEHDGQTDTTRQHSIMQQKSMSTDNQKYCASLEGSPMSLVPTVYDRKVLNMKWKWQRKIVTSTVHSATKLIL